MTTYKIETGRRIESRVTGEIGRIVDIDDDATRICWNPGDDREHISTMTRDDVLTLTRPMEGLVFVSDGGTRRCADTWEN